MASFSFDDTKSFDENCTAFLASLEAIDPGMAKILKANWSKLASIVKSGQRDSKSRTTFNDDVAEALDALLEDATEESV